MLDQGVDHLWLDATGLDRFDERFPTIAAALRVVGLDPSTDWLPIAPAAHYLCGGVLADLDGATSLSGLWAAGEAACNGVHGGNRLASNSLLDGMVFAPRVVEAIEKGKQSAEPTGAMRAVLGDREGGSGIPGRRLPVRIEWDHRRESSSRARAAIGDDAAPRACCAPPTRWPRPPRSPGDRSTETTSPATSSEIWRRSRKPLIAAAIAREESRGADTRTDFPATQRRSRLRLVS